MHSVRSEKGKLKMEIGISTEYFRDSFHNVKFIFKIWPTWITLISINFQRKSEFMILYLKTMISGIILTAANLFRRSRGSGNWRVWFGIQWLCGTSGHAKECIVEQVYILIPTAWKVQTFSKVVQKVKDLRNSEFSSYVVLQLVQQSIFELQENSQLEQSYSDGQSLRKIESMIRLSVTRSRLHLQQSS